MQDMAVLKRGRALLLAVTQDLAEEQLVHIPEGFNNNILWNLGHIVVVQQSVHYGLAGQPLAVSDELVAQCKRGSSPREWTQAPDSQLIKDLLLETADQLAADYQQGLFKNFRSYRSATGFSLTTIDDALAFNLFHEGLHMGAILALRKLVKA